MPILCDYRSLLDYIGWETRDDKLTFNYTKNAFTNGTHFLDILWGRGFINFALPTTMVLIRRQVLQAN